MAYRSRARSRTTSRAPARKRTARRAPARRSTKRAAPRTSQRQQVVRIVVEMPQSQGQFPAALPVKSAPPPRKARF